MKNNLKKVISTVAAVAMSASCFTAFAANFSDVADTAAYKNAVDNLVALGVVGGYEDGTFKPENEITRAEVSKMIVGTMGPAMMNAAEASKGTTSFTDVAGDHWASGFIAQGVSKGYINGMGDGTFAPESKVTYAQTVKMLVSVLGYDEDAKASGGYPNGYITVGSQIGVTKNVNLNADTAVNRGQVAQLINNALQVPLNVITGYTPGISMDENGNIVTVNIPETEVYDGKGDSGKYETLLTTYFTAYAVRGRITDVSEKAQGEVTYDIEWSENFDGDKVDPKDNNYAVVPETVLFPAGLNVDELLFSYTDAIIMENEDGDWELVSIASYGKNEVVTLDSELYMAGSFKNNEIRFYKSLDSSKTDDYDLAKNVKVYVNGTEIKDDSKTTDDEVAEAVAKYVENNATTVVKLVDTPEAGKKTIDGDYDYIMLSVYTSATVSDVVVDETEASIFLDNNDGDILTDVEIVLDFEAVEEGEQEYVLVDTEGNEVKVEDLVEDDVITIYADFEGEALNALSYVEMVVSKNVVEGKVTNEDSDNKKYKVGDAFYGFAHTVDTLKVGDDYTLYLDMFNKIVKFEVATSSLNYAIINRVYTDNSIGEEKVRLVNADGQIVTYTFKDTAEYTTWKSKYDAAASKTFASAYATMVVTYKLNSKNEIHTIANVSNINITGMEEFSEKNARVGSAKMSDATKIVDFITAAKDGWNAASISGKVGAGSIASFTDGAEYQVVYGGEKFTDGTYPLVIVVVGEPGIGNSSAFAVVKSTGSSINEADGMTYDSVTFVQGTEEKTIFFDKAPTLERGDVFVYSLDNEGLVDEYFKLYSAAEGVAFTKVEAHNSKYVTATNNLYEHETYFDFDAFKYTDTEGNTKYKVPTAWVNTVANAENDEYARIGYGVIVDKTSTAVTVGKLTKDADGKYETVVSDTENEIDLANDVNVYVYDFRKAASERVSVGSTGSLAPTKIGSTYMVEDDVKHTITYQWEKAGKKDAVKTVFYKTFEDEITDIIIVIPNA